MKYFSMDIRVGPTGFFKIDEAKFTFYERVVKSIYPSEKVYQSIRVPSSVSFATLIDHRQNIYTPYIIAYRLEEFISRILSIQDNSIDLLMVDFTGNTSVCIREPLLFALANKTYEISSRGICKQFLVLLPELPGLKCSSTQRFESVSGIDEESSVILLSNSGEWKAYASDMSLPSSVKSEYLSAFKELYGSAEAQLEKKCIRRLGHFKSSSPDDTQNNCRIYSYLLHDCDEALYSAFIDWWFQHGKDCRAIAYDLKNNSSFRDIIEAFGDANDIIVGRVEDILEDEQLLESVRQSGDCVLVLDVVEKGIVLKKHINNLNQAGVDVSRNIAASINKNGYKKSTIGKYHVHGFLARSSESYQEKCAQCALELPYTSDQKELFLKIRSFDMMYMVKTSGWESEPPPEVPDNIGKAYPLIPKFSEMLNEYGDWIAYKIHELLKSGNFPDSWIVIHPDEADSTALSNRLESLFENKLCIIKVPRDCIKKAQGNNNDWTQVLDESIEDYWVQQLKSISDSAALMLDIFNGSGSTRISLGSLFRYLNINSCGYICLIDFNPYERGSSVYDIPKHSLYDWYDPRELVMREN